MAAYRQGRLLVQTSTMVNPTTTIRLAERVEALAVLAAMPEHHRETLVLVARGWPEDRASSTHVPLRAVLKFQTIPLPGVPGRPSTGQRTVFR
jgi:hypothetical protein